MLSTLLWAFARVAIGDLTDYFTARMMVMDAQGARKSRLPRIWSGRRNVAHR